MECWEFCREVTKHIPRATRAEREAITWELRDHVMDRAQALEETGCSPGDSIEKAVERMGDPEEIGRAFNEQLSPFWLWLGRASLLLAAALCALVLSDWDGLSRLGQNLVARTAPSLLIDWNVSYFALVEVEEKGESKYYHFWADTPEEAGYTQHEDCDLRLRFGDQVLRVFRIYRNPTNGRVGVILVGYSQDLHGYNGNLTWGTGLRSAGGRRSGETPAPVAKGRYRSRGAAAPVGPGDPDERVDVVFQWQGADRTLCEVPREGESWEHLGDAGYGREGAGVRALMDLPVEPGDTYIVLTCRGEELRIPLPWEVEK